jgi:hypothetical protein
MAQRRNVEMHLKACVIGLFFALLSVVLTAVVHTSFAVVGMILLIPVLPVLFLVTEITLRIRLSGTAGMYVDVVALILGGSVFYGALALVILRRQERRKAKSGF